MVGKIKKWVKILLPILIAVICLLTGFLLSESKDEGLRHNGKATVVLELKSDLEQEDFSKQFEEFIEGSNMLSNADDMITLADTEKTEIGYRVTLYLRRIDKINLRGKFQLKSASELFAEGSESMQQMQDWYEEYYYTTVSVAYGKDRGTITLPRGGEGQISIKPRTTSGEEVEFESFVEQMRKADDSQKVFSLCLLDIENLHYAKIIFPGKIDFIGGDSLKQISENTVEITPVKLETEIETVKNGWQRETVSCALGYVVYTQSMSPFTMCILIMVALLVLLFIVYAILGLRKKGKIYKSKVEAGQIAVDGETTVRKGVMGYGWQAVFGGSTWKKFVRQKSLFLIALPVMLFIAVFFYAPMFGLLIAFQDYNMLEGVGGSEWVGLRNFYDYFINPVSANYGVIRNTLYISIIRIATNFPMILIFALLINEIKRNPSKRLIQTISYIPSYISWVAVGGLAKNLFGDGDGGLLNSLITTFGGKPVSWYTETDPWWMILAMSSLWKSMGWCTIIYMSAMGSINSELYEACTIDGGNRFTQMRCVTLPGLSNIIMLQLFLDVASLLADNADQVMAMTRSQPDLTSTSIIGTSIVGAVSASSGLATATAIGLVQGVVGLIFVLVMTGVSKRTESEGLF